MLIWLSALHCEAKPIVDFYRMKKPAARKGFDLYLGDGNACIVSGIGRVAAARATDWAASLFPEKQTGWINLGIAGTSNAEIGSAFWVEQIICQPSGRQYFPRALFDTGFDTARCQTLDGESQEYIDDLLFDMEASAFFDSASNFSGNESIHCIKIVSDNRERNLGRDKRAISDMIHRHIEAIDRFARNLQAQIQS